MTPFYTFTTPVFRGLPSSLFFPFIFSLSSLWLTRGGPNRHWVQSGQSESHTKRNCLKTARGCTIRRHERYKNKNSLLRRCELRIYLIVVTTPRNAAPLSSPLPTQTATRGRICHCK